MGHKRLGYLPKSKAWRIIVAELAEYALGNAEISSIAQNTLGRVQEQFSSLSNDPSIKCSFEFLLQVSLAFRTENPIKYLAENKILEKEELSLLKLARAASNYKSGEVESHEYQTFARQAAIDAINNWYSNHKDEGETLFSAGSDTTAVFSKIGNGRGFCEISRLYFSKLTERYLKYFLEREAATKITNINDRKRFSSEIERHVNDISKHAFETARITQSYSAAWYNKRIKGEIPDESVVRGFLSYALGKMKSELLMEEMK